MKGLILKETKFSAFQCSKSHWNPRQGSQRLALRLGSCTLPSPSDGWAAVVEAACRTVNLTGVPRASHSCAAFKSRESKALQAEGRTAEMVMEVPLGLLVRAGSLKACTWLCNCLSLPITRWPLLVWPTLLMQWSLDLSCCGGHNPGRIWVMHGVKNSSEMGNFYSHTHKRWIQTGGGTEKALWNVKENIVVYIQNLAYFE